MMSRKEPGFNFVHKAASCGEEGAVMAAEGAASGSQENPRMSEPVPGTNTSKTIKGR